MGLGRRRLIEFDGRAVDAVDAGHELSRSDQDGQWVRGTSVLMIVRTGNGLHGVTLRATAGVADTIRDMETDLATDGAVGDDAEHPGVAGAPATGGEAGGTDAGPPDSPEASIDAVEHVLDQVEEALTRLDDGTYGRCGSCGGVIEDARLTGLPMTQTCSACASPGAEGPASSQHRPGRFPEQDGPDDSVDDVGPSPDQGDVGSPSDQG